MKLLQLLLVLSTGFLFACGEEDKDSAADADTAAAEEEAAEEEEATE